ncbi:hypothetical protein [Solimonas soli]|uniref:hypothetical protein n=1 Tax=Solimonas soli TaxID=413479 RepID=UPI00048A38A1|nr:hypothetical protein [Solimonas soli]
MNRHPPIPARDDDDGAAWLRAALRDDLAQAPYLDDAGFSARVVRQLPAPRRRLPWLDGIGLLFAIAALAVGLGPLLGEWMHAAGASIDALARTAPALLTVPREALDGSLSLHAALNVLAPLAALALAAVLLAEI